MALQHDYPRGDSSHAYHEEFYRPPMRWFAVYVRSRHEARVAKHFKDREIEFFLPLYKEERKWSDRKVEIQLPLFPGYLFVRMRRTLETLFRVVEVPGVITIVGRGSSPEALEDAEIDQLKQAMSNGHKPQPHKLMKAGDKVKITRGPLQGAEGFLVREKGKHRVVLTIGTIERSMSVEVDMSAVEPITDGYAAYTAMYPELRDMKNDI
jgi:transcription elongation factor/antiterminator RfaH